MRVRVYRNLHRDCLSVQTYTPGKGWRVTDHVQSINLDDVSFSVSDAGYIRFLRERVKNVHAFVIGETTSEKWNGGIPVGYNPNKGRHFVNKETGKPVCLAKHATVSKNGIVAVL